MEELALVYVHARIVWHLPAIEPTDGLYHIVEVFCRFLAACRWRRLDSPLRELWIPVRAGDFGGEAEHGIQVELSRKTLPVLLNLRACGILFAPLGILHADMSGQRLDFKPNRGGL